MLGQGLPWTTGEIASVPSPLRRYPSSNSVKLPPHIGAGTRVVMMMADGSYVERAKD